MSRKNNRMLQRERGKVLGALCVSGLLEPFVWKTARPGEVPGQALLLMQLYVFLCSLLGCSSAGSSLSSTHLSLGIYVFATFKILPNLYEELKEKAHMVCLAQGLSLCQQ